MNYYERARSLATFNTEPTLTDQSGAKETDLNIIVQRFTISGQLPQGSGQPTYGDFSQLPADLRGFIETAEKLDELRSQLPEQLRNMETTALLALTPDQVRTIIGPPDKPDEKPETKTEEKK